MRYRYGYHSGFTLIELLVVISIIALLSTIVLATLSNARNKARDAAVKQLAAQMKNVYELEYSNKATYFGLMKSEPAFSCSRTANVLYSCTLINQNACNTFYGVNSEGSKICLDILSKGVNLNIGTVDPNNFVDKYAVFLQYPGNSSLGRCVGSSGNVTDQLNQSNCFVSGAGW